MVAVLVVVGSSTSDSTGSSTGGMSAGYSAGGTSTGSSTVIGTCSSIGSSSTGSYRGSTGGSRLAPFSLSPLPFLLKVVVSARKAGRCCCRAAFFEPLSKPLQRVYF